MCKFIDLFVATDVNNLSNKLINYIYIYIYILNTLAILYTVYHLYTGTEVAQCLRHSATNRKIAGSIPAGVIGIFH